MRDPCSSMHEPASELQHMATKLCQISVFFFSMPKADMCDQEQSTPEMLQLDIPCAPGILLCELYDIRHRIAARWLHTF